MVNGAVGIGHGEECRHRAQFCKLSPVIFMSTVAELHPVDQVDLLPSDSFGKTSNGESVHQ
jgi:hypothetical protein